LVGRSTLSISGAMTAPKRR